MGGWVGGQHQASDREADSRQRGRHKASPQHDLQVLKLFRLPPTQMIRMEIPLSDSVPIEILQLAPPASQCKWRKRQTRICIKGLCKSFPPPKRPLLECYIRPHLTHLLRTRWQNSDLRESRKINIFFQCQLTYHKLSQSLHIFMCIALAVEELDR